MKQQTALNILKTGKNVFLTGSAGAGKTYTLNQYIQWLKARRIKVAVTASTGIAATHMNGMTIHTWAGIGIKDSLDIKDMQRMKERKYLRQHLDEVAVLIIDEISMLHAKQLDLVNQVLKFFRDKEEGFGGIQVVLAGDFFQLPPIGKSGERNRDKFAFMSQAWLDAELTICYLTEQHRQTGDSLDTEDSYPDPSWLAKYGLDKDSPLPDLAEILNAIRSGNISQAAYAQLTASRYNQLTLNPTRLFTHNANVDVINQQELAKLKTETHEFVAVTSGNEKLVKTLTNSVRAPETLILKKSAQVMFVKNNFEQGTFNGSLGEVVGFVNDAKLGKLPKVKLTDGSTLVVEPEEWTVESDSGEVLASFSQIPLCYAWAITVHKSQGMTLEAAEIDLSKTFEDGQGYVALSRLKSLTGLKLTGFNERALRLDRLAHKADTRFQELSEQAEHEWQDMTPKTLQQRQTNFVKRAGGITNQKLIDQYDKRLKIANASNLNSETLIETRMLLEESLTIAEIAAERELAQSTIVNHIAKLLKEDNPPAVEHLRPDETIVEQVARAAQAVVRRRREDDFSDDGTIRLRPIFEKLGEKISYNDIRLALLFVDLTQD